MGIGLLAKIGGGRERMKNEIFNQIANTIVEGDPSATVEGVRQALEMGWEPLDIINQGLVVGMNIISEQYSNGECFLPNLVIAARCMERSMQVLEPELKKRQQEVKSAGRVVIGTVQGDIHEIGKSLVGTMLAVNGFQVYDLGVNVSPEAFIAKIRETGAQLLGMSALLTTTMTVQREVIRQLEAEGMRDQIRVMVGGAPVTASWADEIGADGYAEDAVGAVGLAQRLMGLGG